MVNPFFEKYTTPHQTPPFNLIKMEHYEEAFMEGIRRDDEHIDKLINNPEPPTFDNTIIDTEDDNGYYDLLDNVSTVFFNLLSAETNDEILSVSRLYMIFITIL